jgi:hypothetical protein
MEMRGHMSFSFKESAQAELLRDGPASYQLVGEVTAHQGYDG